MFDVSRLAVGALALGLLAACAPAAVEAPTSWSLDSDRSSLSFVSIKAGDLPESHRFGSLSGVVSASGEAQVDISLASVDTGIEIRDERMREHVFQLDSFPVASLSANLDISEITALAPGDQLEQDITVELGFSGLAVPIQAKVTVLRLEPGEVVVTAREPVLLNADAIGIADGLATLQSLAGLPSISKAVPVDFVLTFVGADSAG